MEVKGVFDVQKLYDALALIISQRENVKVTVRVTEKENEGKENLENGKDRKTA